MISRPKRIQERKRQLSNIFSNPNDQKSSSKFIGKSSSAVRLTRVYFGILWLEEESYESSTLSQRHGNKRHHCCASSFMIKDLQCVVTLSSTFSSSLPRDSPFNSPSVPSQDYFQDEASTFHAISQALEKQLSTFYQKGRGRGPGPRSVLAFFFTLFQQNIYCNNLSRTVSKKTARPKWNRWSVPSQYSQQIHLD